MTTGTRRRFEGSWYLILHGKMMGKLRSSSFRKVGTCLHTRQCQISGCTASMFWLIRLSWSFLTSCQFFT